MREVDAALRHSVDERRPAYVPPPSWQAAMSWQCKLTDHEHKHKIGAIWHYPTETRLFITLPCGSMFPADGHHDAPNGVGWTVTGEPPNITMTPSIRVHGGWHGYITNGVLSDDVEGKTWPSVAS